MQSVWHWIAHGSSTGEVLDSACTTAEVTHNFRTGTENQASEVRDNISKCFPINQPAITSAKKIQPSLVLWARLMCAPCMRASPVRLAPKIVNTRYSVASGPHSENLKIMGYA